MKLVTILEIEIKLFLTAELQVLKIHFSHSIEVWYSLDPAFINSKSLRRGYTGEIYLLDSIIKYGSCLCGNWKHSFLTRLIFNWRTFSRRVTARWSCG